MSDNIITLEVQSNTSQPDKPQHQCPKCTRTFSNVGHLKCHFYRVHSEFRLATCTVSASPSPPENCALCKKNFASKSELEEHQCSNDNQIAENKCEKCDRVFTKKSSLFRHTVRIHEKIHVCHICDKEFASKSYLDAHCRKHTKEQLFSCDICNEVFASEEILKNHCLTHEKIFTCKVCQKNFGRKCHLVRHSVSHMKK